MIGTKKKLALLNQSDAKLKAVMTCPSAFSRALGGLPVLTLISHWITIQVVFSFFNLSKALSNISLLLTLLLHLQIWSLAFSRALDKLVVFILGSYWLIVIFPSI